MTISFETQRLRVLEVEGEFSLTEPSVLLARVPRILTPSVVESLPSYFHGITSVELAETWFDRMLLESRLLQVKSEKCEIIGFLFAYVENGSYAHIGYLLAEEYWGRGLASELLQGFIGEVVKTEPWLKLIAGVEQSNVASVKVLEKLGFVEQSVSDSSVLTYEYMLS